MLTGTSCAHTQQRIRQGLALQLRRDLQEVSLAGLQPPQGKRQRSVCRRARFLLAHFERVLGPSAPMEAALIRNGRDAGQGRRTPQLLHQDAVLRGAGRLHAYRHLVASP